MHVYWSYTFLEIIAKTTDALTIILGYRDDVPDYFGLRADTVMYYRVRGVDGRKIRLFASPRKSFEYGHAHWCIQCANTTITAIKYLELNCCCRYCPYISVECARCTCMIVDHITIMLQYKYAAPEIITNRNRWNVHNINCCIITTQWLMLHNAYR